ncbi:MAG: STAS domain-containing protein [Spirochaeta sp.]|jgi:anti-anti-sigma factor|nr:STAS domain-containing protein [Spirochaeta sp.]
MNLTRQQRDLLHHEDQKLTVNVVPTDDDETLVLAIAGKVDTDNSPVAAKIFKRVFELSPVPGTLILETGRLTYASSTGIGMVAAIQIDCRKNGVRLKVANINDSVKKIFDLLGFSAFFSFITWP